MTYAAATIATTLDRINRSLFLPAIQRPYVWESDQIVALFDSLLKGYPISSFLPSRRVGTKDDRYSEPVCAADGARQDCGEPFGRHQEMSGGPSR